MAKEVRIGLIGAGRIGNLHGNNITHSIKGARIEAVADAFLTDQQRAWAEGLGVNAQKIGTDPAKIFADKDVDAVFICSSTSTHADLVIQAAQAGKQIFCEKPLDFDPKKIQTALDAVQKAGVQLQVGFVRRFDHNHKRVRDIVASGKMGKPSLIKVCSRDPEGQKAEYMKTSGGIFIDNAERPLPSGRGGKAVEVRYACRTFPPHFSLDKKMQID
jgi:myo-inositol 2-dehydrogenase/D-chiro-inositol 1-dehydrogenase